MTQASFLIHPGERSRFIRSTLKYLCRIPHFQHQWRTADHLATLCHKWFTIPEPLQFDGNNVNNVLQKDPALKLDILAEKSAPNQFVIYHDTYRQTRRGSGRLHCYYLCDPDGNECFNHPPVGMAWYDTAVPQVDSEIQVLEHVTRLVNKEQRQFPVDVIDLVAKTNALTQERDNKLENERKTKKRRLHESDNSGNSTR